MADRVTCKRRAPDPALFVGSGKAEEIKMLAQSTGASEVLFDQALSPAQQRNLERALGLPVNDRTFSASAGGTIAYKRTRLSVALQTLQMASF